MFDGMARADDPIAALFEPLAAAPRELCAAAYFDRRGALLGLRHCGAGDTSTVELPFRSITIDTLAFGARDVVLAHNHPSGDPRPSDADLALTRRLSQALAAIDAHLHDHLIMVAGSRFSFREAGLL